MLTLIWKFSCKVFTYLLLTGEEVAQMQPWDYPLSLPKQESHQQKEPQKLLDKLRLFRIGSFTPWSKFKPTKLKKAKALLPARRTPSLPLGSVNNLPVGQSRLAGQVSNQPFPSSGQLSHLPAKQYG